MNPSDVDTTEGRRKEKNQNKKESFMRLNEILRAGITIKGAVCYMKRVDVHVRVGGRKNEGRKGLRQLAELPLGLQRAQRRG